MNSDVEPLEEEEIDHLIGKLHEVLGDDFDAEYVLSKLKKKEKRSSSTNKKRQTVQFAAESPTATAMPAVYAAPNEQTQKLTVDTKSLDFDRKGAPSMFSQTAPTSLSIDFTDINSGGDGGSRMSGKSSVTRPSRYSLGANRFSTRVSALPAEVLSYINGNKLLKPSTRPSLATPCKDPYATFAASHSLNTAQLAPLLVKTNSESSWLQGSSLGDTPGTGTGTGTNTPASSRTSLNKNVFRSTASSIFTEFCVIGVQSDMIAGLKCLENTSLQPTEICEIYHASGRNGGLGGRVGVGVGKGGLNSEDDFAGEEKEDEEEDEAPLVGNLHEYCFPHGAELRYITYKEMDAMHHCGGASSSTGNSTDYFSRSGGIAAGGGGGGGAGLHGCNSRQQGMLSYQIMQFTDATNTVFYATCVISTEPIVQPTDSLLANLDSLQNSMAASNTIKRFIRYYIYRKKRSMLQEMNALWERNISNAKSTSILSGATDDGTSDTSKMQPKKSIFRVLKKAIGASFKPKKAPSTTSTNTSSSQEFNDAFAFRASEHGTSSSSNNHPHTMFSMFSHSQSGTAFMAGHGDRDRGRDRTRKPTVSFDDVGSSPLPGDPVLGIQPTNSEDLSSSDLDSTRHGPRPPPPATLVKQRSNSFSGRSSLPLYFDDPAVPLVPSDSSSSSFSRSGSSNVSSASNAARGTPAKGSRGISPLCSAGTYQSSLSPPGQGGGGGNLADCDSPCVTFRSPSGTFTSRPSTSTGIASPSCEVLADGSPSRSNVSMRRLDNSRKRFGVATQKAYCIISKKPLHSLFFQVLEAVALKERQRAVNKCCGLLKLDTAAQRASGEGGGEMNASFNRFSNKRPSFSRGVNFALRPLPDSPCVDIESSSGKSSVSAPENPSIALHQRNMFLAQLNTFDFASMVSALEQKVPPHKARRCGGAKIMDISMPNYISNLIISRKVVTLKVF
jgi:hypothetical protein